jgi:hypothetical protein
MSDIFVEQGDNKWVAIQNRRIIATGDTQEQAAERAHRKKPDDPVLGERVRRTTRGKPDKWRRMYP